MDWREQVERWRKRLKASHSIERDTDDALVLRSNWQVAVAVGVVLTILGSPIIIAALRTTDSTNRIALSLMGLACPGGALVLALYGWVTRNSLIVVDRVAQTIRWGSKRPVPFSDVARIVTRTKRNREGTDSRGHASYGLSFELVVVLSSGRKRKLMTAVEPEPLAHVTRALMRLTSGHRIPLASE